MDHSTVIEMIGYFSSLLVVVSMLMSSVIKLRVINSIGSGIFAVYALIIHSYPTAMMNICLVAINIYNLVRLSKKEQSYDLIDAESEDRLLNYILSYYRNDIQKYFPGFTGNTADLNKAYIVCCNGNPAGVLLGKMKEKGAVDVVLDYSVPVYRDCSVGAYLYSKLPAKGVHTLVYSGQESHSHIPYLTKMGFVRENGGYIKRL